MFEETFNDEFEEMVLIEVEDRVGFGARQFLEEHDEDWRGYKAIIRDEASQRNVEVDELAQEVMVDAVVEHMNDFSEEYELDEYRS